MFERYWNFHFHKNFSLFFTYLDLEFLKFYSMKQLMKFYQ